MLSKLTRSQKSVVKTELFPAIFVLIFVMVLAGCKSGSTEAHFIDRAKTLIDQKEYTRAIIELKNAQRLNPKSAESYYLTALAYEAMGNPQAEYQTLLQATELDPKHVKAQEKLAEIVGRSVGSARTPEQLREAQKRIQAVLAIVPDSADALSALGLTEYLLGKPEDGMKQLQAALDKFPQNLRAAKDLAFVKMKNKDLAGAEQVLTKAAAESPNSAEAQLALGRFFALTGRAKEAEAADLKALAIDPKNGAALYDLAMRQIATGRKEEAEKTLTTLSALPDKQYGPLHAIYLYDNGHVDEALKEFEKRAADDPSDRAAFTRLTTAYFVARRFSDAERTINAAVKKNSKDTSALLERSKMYLMTAKLSEAESDLNQVVHADPNSAVAYYLLSQVLMARGQVFPARQQLGKALDYDPSLLAARLELAQSLMSSGGAQAAVNLLNEAPASQKSALPFRVATNWALFGTGDRTELRKSIDAGLAAYKLAPDLVLQDGLYKFQAKDIAGARKAFEEVLARQPDNLVAVDSLAKTYSFQKQTDTALHTVEQYAAKRPSSAPLQNLLGDWMKANKRNDAARKAYAAALALDPALADARMNTALLDAAEGKLDSARQTLQSLTGAPAMQARAEVTLGMLDEKAGNPAAAIAHYRKTLAVDPNNVPALNNLAYLLADGTNQIDEALKMAQQAKELDPSSVLVEDTIGWAFYKKGIYDTALAHLRSAAEKEPSARRKYHLAMAYYKSGERELGSKTLKEARSMDPRLPESSAAQALVTSLER